jgi:Zn-dependent protease with chaperone function
MLMTSLLQNYTFKPKEQNASALDLGNKTRDHLKEKLLDIKYPLFKIIEEIFLSPLLRPLKTILTLSISLSPQTVAFPSMMRKYQLKQITTENIDRGIIFPQGSLPTGVNAPTPERLKALIQKVDVFAKKMGIKNKIDLYTSSKICSTGCVGGTYSRNALFIMFDLNFINASNDELDAVICHELTHIKENHLFKKALFSLTVLAIDIIASILIFPCAFFAIEAAASLIDKVIARKYEKDCDYGAMNLLGTGKGLASFFERYAKKAADLKNTTNFNQFVQKLDPRKVVKLKNKGKLTEAYMRKMQNRITPEGNNRRDFAHPSLTARAAYAREFSPLSRTQLALSLCSSA